MLEADPTKNYIEVCSSKCAYLSSSSTSTIAKCSLPSVSTTYSNQNFGISTESEDLRAEKYFGSNANFAKAFDNNNLNNAGDMSTDCHIGGEFKTGFIGLLSQVKYFIHDLVKENYSGMLSF
jgi:hypothetical protein